MSFRHTYTTQFFYRHDKPEELERIRKALEKYCRLVEWKQCGSGENIGYFHGFISDLDGRETKEVHEKEILEHLEKQGIRIKIVYE